MTEDRLADVLRVCQEALAREGAERGAYLNATCGSDSDLRRDVEAVLAEQSRAEDVLEQPAWQAPSTRLTPGTRLGGYEIDAAIGAGGMGDVYKGRDTRLDRSVAIKVLPDIFSGDPERLARFEREAKLLASLNHPNIAAIYGLDVHEGTRFIVMELVEGETLAQKLARAPHSPIVTDQMTRPGVILGTAAYMSPEQAKGEAADKRADIWAFGCVLYECLTGKRAFRGDTITETVAAILKSEPDWTLLPLETPPFVRTVLRQCLQKDPNLGLRDIGDARIEMHEAIERPADTVPAPRRIRPGWLIATGMTALVIGVVIGPGVTKYFRPGTSQISQLVVRAPVRVEPGYWLDGLRLSPPYGSDHPTRTTTAISSDGRFMVYSAVREHPGTQDTPHLYLRRLDQLEATPIAGTDGGINPFLSPDDRWIGFWADGKLMKVSAEGGVPAVLCDVSQSFGSAPGTSRWMVGGF